jgi:hypothetical protein
MSSRTSRVALQLAAMGVYEAIVVAETLDDGRDCRTGCGVLAQCQSCRRSWLVGTVVDHFTTNVVDAPSSIGRVSVTPLPSTKPMLKRSR